MTHSPAHGLRKAIELAGNSQTELARRLGIRPQQVCKWMRKGVVPLKRVPQVAKAVGMRPCELRPDLPDFFGGC